MDNAEVSGGGCELGAPAEAGGRLQTRLVTQSLYLKQNFRMAKCGIAKEEDVSWEHLQRLEDAFKLVL
jgi:hypothetical protein